MVSLMSKLHVRHIEQALESEFSDTIVMADYDDHDDSTRRSAFLSRALAAFPIAAFTDSPAREIALGITDGFFDNGIDLIHYDLSQERLYLVQSKWRADGNASPSVADVQKFLQGIRDLLNLNFDRFNDKVNAQKQQIVAALDNPRATIEAVFVHTGVHELSSEAQNLFSDLEDQINDAGEILSLRTMKQSDVHALVSSGVDAARVDLDIALFDWGQITEPYSAFYGQVAVSDIGAWYRDHGSDLFDRNLRKFIADSEVNHTIAESARQSPETFWYYNNGVTILCQSIVRKAIGGIDRKHGQFRCEGVSIVNGAQTVGAIGQALSSAQGSVTSTADGRVLVRLISLENCPSEFASAVTRATNTQNRIVSRDFVALDEQQERLRVELRIEKKTYALKTGDADPPPAHGCSVVEATVALGCADPDVQLAVQVKREIGRIWEDTESAMYRRLFNSSTTSTRLWLCITAMRAVDEILREIQVSEEGRRRQVAVHGNRLILHTVFRRMPEFQLQDASSVLDMDTIRSETSATFELFCKKIERDYDGNYLASLFKNRTKCTDVVETTLQALEVGSAT